MSVYLHDIPLDQAQARLQQALQEAGLWGPLGLEWIALDDQAFGRVLAEPVWAKICSPHYHASAMDGFALRAELTNGAMPTAPVVLTLGDQAVYVDTGDPLPDWANAVVPIENTEPIDTDGNLSSDARHPAAIRLRSGLTPWAHVRPMGEDIVATQLVLPSHHTLRPVDLGAIAASGHTQIAVSRIPRVGVIPTGTELVAIGSELKRGDILDFNSVVLAAQIREWGGLPTRYPITRDDFNLIKQQVQQAADENDLVLLNAGSSAGSEDYSARVVEELGELLVHGVAVRPGHPVILGMLRRTPQSAQPDRLVPIVGIPGYPVSAALTGEIFVQPLLHLWLGRPVPQKREITAQITRKVTSPAGDDDYMRVIVGKVGQRMLAAPLSRGAGVITSLVRADGICVLPRGVQGVEAGAEVKVKLYRSIDDLDRTIFAIGSHDMTLDILAHFLSNRSRRLVSANVGSQGGLVALRRQEAHLAGCHLLDAETGEYNSAAVRQYLPNLPVKIFHWVGREQGLLVKPGNPKRIEGIYDLSRPEVRYVNRQRGAGTRVLLDYHLQKLGIPTDAVSGYDEEEYTHLAVAAAVSSGRADCGMGITAAAFALGLDFIPLFHEEYDLVIPEAFMDEPLLQPIFDLMNDQEFRAVVASQPGYDVSRMGLERKS